MNVEEQFKKDLDNMIGVKKIYTKRFTVSKVDKLEEIAAACDTNVTKIMELAFSKLIKEFEYWGGKNEPSRH